MSKRSSFVEKNSRVHYEVKRLAPHPEYHISKPIRGITEIENLIDLVVKHNSYICGGYARYCISSSPTPAAPIDIDIFSFDEDSHEKVIDAYSETYCFDEDQPEETNFSVSFRPAWSEHPELSHVKKIQFIKPSDKRKTVGNIVDILQRFDFTVTKAALLSKNEVLLHKGLLCDDQAGILRIPGDITNPLAAFTRVIKYVKKGYNVSPHTLIKIMDAWHIIEDKEKLSILSELVQSIVTAGDSAIWDQEVSAFEIESLQHNVGELVKRANLSEEEELDISFVKEKPSKTLSTIYANMKTDKYVDEDEQNMVKEISRIPEYPF